MGRVAVDNPDVMEPRASAPASLARSRDWLRHPLSVLIWWALPLALGISTNFLHRTVPQTALVWAIALAWMGTGCALNAIRCGRRHCFISAPVLWLGAIAAALLALRLVTGQSVLGEVVNGTLAVAALSFLAERFWGIYATRNCRVTDRRAAGS